jgi:hypothetical protein
MLILLFSRILVICCWISRGRARPAIRVAYHATFVCAARYDRRLYDLGRRILVFSSFSTAVVGLGKPTVRFGIPFKTQKKKRYSHHQRDGAWVQPCRTAPHHAVKRSEPPEPTRRPYMSSNIRWSARNLKQSATNWRDKARASPLRSRAACTRNGIVGRTDSPPMHTCMTRRNGKDDAKGYRRANNHAMVEVSKPLAAFLHRRTTATHSTEEAAK